MIVFKIVFISFACFAGKGVCRASHSAISEVKLQSSSFYLLLMGLFSLGAF